MNESFARLFVEQPLALPGSANNFYLMFRVTTRFLHTPNFPLKIFLFSFKYYIMTLSKKDALQMGWSGSGLISQLLIIWGTIQKVHDVFITIIKLSLLTHINIS